MPLHGDIKVNDHLIGTWRASNTLERRGEFVLYAVAVDYTDNAGYHQHAEFEVEHVRGDGALILASKVLANAPEHMRYPTLGGDGNAVRAMAERMSR